MLLLAFVTAALSILSPLSLLSSNVPLVLTKGQEVWNIPVSKLPAKEGLVFALIVMLPNLAWFWGVLQIIRLAVRYRQGMIFDVRNAVCFTRLGVALVLMGILSSLTLPAANYLLYCRGISPWLADMLWQEVLYLDPITAGVLFYVLGKIMQRGAVLQENDKLTV